ncbi:substrate-binding domain-containing protein [Tautonia plasticadhaerens]|uniref:Anaerobic benzoate catabolism transcriptional regulator n=1 Tax=Tautonia plasticadhaerens TaxID=2527974 RepID=A0A518GWD5_9BACT|nr:substrate-binding domain-containing protein [Tautonia plasticadhaerens]QDV32893.1 anaerobic benzoate catabolism transcriptional regulator [Tautonia plasticadhaerens]
MSDLGAMHNRVKARRRERGWSQEELSRRAGISRAAVSAVETGRLVPSVLAAIGLAEALGASVEELFGRARPAGEDPSWAWPATTDPCRFWRAEVGGRIRLYPAEPTPGGVVAHDGVARGGAAEVDGGREPGETLVLACCDPAAGLLAAEYEKATGFRLLVLPRSSGRALELLREGLVHAAGLHLSTPEDPDGNARAVSDRLGEAWGLLGVARWEEGLAVAGGVPGRSVRSILQADLCWVGRESGSGARKCLDRLRAGRPEPGRVAFDHRGVADAIRFGWAEAGVCLRLAAEEAGLRVLGIQVEAYELCVPVRLERDPRLQALIRVVRSAPYRRALAALPGYDPSGAGEWRRVEAGAAAPVEGESGRPGPSG